MLREPFEPLAEPPEANRLADLHPAARGALPPAQHPKQRGLARAVLAENADTVAWADDPRHVVEDVRGAVVRDPHVARLDDLLAETTHRHALQLDGVAQRRIVGDELEGRIHAELRLARARLRSVRQPVELLAQHALTTLLDDACDAVTFDALLHIRGEATLERFDSPVVHLPHARADLVEEPTVVRDHQQSAGVIVPAAPEMLRQPLDRVQVEMVGGLVHEHDVPRSDQETREVRPAPLPAGEVSHAPLPVEVADQDLHDLPRARVRRPFVGGHVADDGVLERIIVVELVALSQHAHGDAAPVGYVAGIRLDVLRDE